MAGSSTPARPPMTSSKGSLDGLIREMQAEHDVVTRLDVEVTSEDIALGIRGDAALCPLARAIRRAFGPCRVEVNLDVPEARNAARCIGLYGIVLRWQLPGDILHRVRRFDAGWPMKPFAVRLTVVPAGRPMAFEVGWEERRA